MLRFSRSMPDYEIRCIRCGMRKAIACGDPAAAEELEVIEDLLRQVRHPLAGSATSVILSATTHHVGRDTGGSAKDLKVALGTRYGARKRL